VINPYFALRESGDDSVLAFSRLSDVRRLRKTYSPREMGSFEREIAKIENANEDDVTAVISHR